MAVTGNIKSQNVGNTNSIWFYACDVLESRVTVSKVEIMLSNGAYHSCDPASWWKCQSLPVSISLPMSVRLTAANNEVLTSTAVVTSFTQGSIFDFGANFGSPAGPLPTPQPTPQPTQPTPQPVTAPLPTPQPTQPTPQPTQPTPKPVTAPQPTPQPVAAPLPTPQPVTVGGGGDCSSASCITVTIVEGSEWWFRAKLSGVPNGVTIEKVEVRNSNSNWETGVFQGQAERSAEWSDDRKGRGAQFKLELGDRRVSGMVFHRISRLLRLRQL